MFMLYLSTLFENMYTFQLCFGTTAIEEAERDPIKLTTIRSVDTFAHYL